MPDLELSQYGYAVDFVDQQKNKKQASKNIQESENPLIDNSDESDSGASSARKSQTNSKKTQMDSSVPLTVFRKLHEGEVFLGVPQDQEPHPDLLGIKPEGDRNLWDLFYVGIQKKKWLENFRLFQAYMLEVNKWSKTFVSNEFLNQVAVDEKVAAYEELKKQVDQCNKEIAELNAINKAKKKLLNEDAIKELKQRKKYLEEKVKAISEAIVYARSNPLQAKDEELKGIAKKFPFANTTVENVFGAEVDSKIKTPQKGADAPEIFSRSRLSYNLSANTKSQAGFRGVYQTQSFRGLARISKAIPLLRQYINGGSQSRGEEIKYESFKWIAKQDRPNIILRKLFFFTDAVKKREQLYQARKQMLRSQQNALEFYNRSLVLEMFERLGNFLSTVSYLDAQNENTIGTYVSYINTYLNSSSFQQGQNRIKQFFDENRAEVERKGLDLFYLSMAEPDFNLREKFSADEKITAIQKGKKQYIQFKEEDFSAYKKMISGVLAACYQTGKKGNSNFSEAHLKKMLAGYFDDKKLGDLFSTKTSKKRTFVSFFQQAFEEAVSVSDPTCKLKTRDELITRLKTHEEIINDSSCQKLIQPLLNALLNAGVDTAARQKMKTKLPGQNKAVDHDKAIQYGMVALLDEKISNQASASAHSSSKETNVFDYQTMREDVELFYKKQELLSSEGIVKIVSERIREEALQEKGKSDAYRTKTILYLQYLGKLVDAELVMLKEKQNLKNLTSDEKNELSIRKKQLENLKKSTFFFDKLISRALFDMVDAEFQSHLNEGVNILKPLNLQASDLEAFVKQGFEKELNALTESFKERNRVVARQKAKNIKRFHQLVKARGIQMNDVAELKSDIAQRASTEFANLFTLRLLENHAQHEQCLANMLARGNKAKIAVETQIQDTDVKLASGYLALTLDAAEFKKLENNVNAYLSKSQGATSSGYSGSDMYLSLVIRFLETMNPEVFGNQLAPDQTLSKKGIMLQYGEKRLAHLKEKGFLGFDLGEDAKINAKAFSFPQARMTHSLDLAFFQDVMAYQVKIDKQWILVSPTQEAHNLPLEKAFQSQLKSYLEDANGTHIQSLFLAFKNSMDAGHIRKIWFLYESHADTLTRQAFRIEFLKQLLSLDPNSDYLKTFLDFYKDIKVSTQLVSSGAPVNTQGLVQEVLKSSFVTDADLKQKLTRMLNTYLPQLNSNVALNKRVSDNQNKNKHLVYEGLAPWMGAQYRIERLKQAHGIWTDPALMESSQENALKKKNILDSILEDYLSIAIDLKVKNTVPNSTEIFTPRLKIQNEANLLSHDESFEKVEDERKKTLRADWEAFCREKIGELKGQPILWSKEFAIILKTYANDELLGNYLATQLGNVLASGIFSQAEQFIKDLIVILKIDTGNDLSLAIQTITANDKMQAQFKQYLDSSITQVNAGFLYLLKKLLPSDLDSVKALWTQFRQKRTDEIFEMPSLAKKDDLCVRGFNSEITDPNTGSMAIRKLEYFECFAGWSAEEKNYIENEYQFYQNLQLSQDRVKFNAFFGCDPKNSEDILRKQLAEFATRLDPKQYEKQEANAQLGWRINLLDWFSQNMRDEPSIKDYYAIRTRKQNIVTALKAFSGQLKATFENGSASSSSEQTHSAVLEYRERYANVKNAEPNQAMQAAQVDLDSSLEQAQEKDKSLEDQNTILKGYETQIIFYMLSLRANISEQDIDSKVRKIILGEQQAKFEEENKKQVSGFLASLEQKELAQIERPRDLESEFRRTMTKVILEGEKKLSVQEMRSELNNNVLDDESIKVAYIQYRIEKAKKKDFLSDVFKEKTLFEIFEEEYQKNLKSKPQKLFQIWYARCLVMSKYMTWAQIMALSNTENQDKFYSEFEKCLDKAFEDENKIFEGAVLSDRYTYFDKIKGRCLLRDWTVQFKEVGNLILTFLNSQQAEVNRRVDSKINNLSTAAKGEYKQEARGELQAEQEHQIARVQRVILDNLNKGINLTSHHLLADSFYDWYAKCLMMLDYIPWTQVIELSKAEETAKFDAEFKRCLELAVIDVKNKLGHTIPNPNTYFSEFKQDCINQWRAQFDKSKENSNSSSDLFDFVYGLAEQNISKAFSSQDFSSAKVISQEKPSDILNGQIRRLSNRIELKWISPDKQILAKMLLRTDWIERESGFQKGEKAAILRLVLDNPDIFIYIQEHQNDSFAMAKLFNTIYADVNRYREANCSKLKDAFNLENQELDGWIQLAHDLETRKEAGIYTQPQFDAICEKARNSFSKLITRFFNFELFDENLPLISEEDRQELQALHEVLTVLDPAFIKTQEVILKQKCEEAKLAISLWVKDMKIDAFRFKGEAHSIQLQNQIYCLGLWGSQNQKQALIQSVPADYLDANSSVYANRACSQRLLVLQTLINTLGGVEEQKTFNAITTKYQNYDQQLEKICQGAFVTKEDGSFIFGTAIMQIHNGGTQDQYQKLKALRDALKTHAAQLRSQFDLPQTLINKMEQNDLSKDAQKEIRRDCQKVMGDFLSAITGDVVTIGKKENHIIRCDGTSWNATREALEKNNTKFVFRKVARLLLHIYVFLDLAVQTKNVKMLEYFDTWFSDVMKKLNEACEKRKAFTCTNRVAFMVIDHLLNGWERAATSVIDIQNLGSQFSSLSNSAKTNAVAWQYLSAEFMKQLHAETISVSPVSSSKAQINTPDHAPTTTAAPAPGINSTSRVSSSTALSRTSSQSVISPKLGQSGVSSQSVSPKVSSPAQAGVPSPMNASSSASSQTSTPDSQGPAVSESKNQGAQTPEMPNTPKSPSKLGPIKRGNQIYSRDPKKKFTATLGFGAPIASPNSPPLVAGADAQSSLAAKSSSTVKAASGVLPQMQNASGVIKENQVNGSISKGSSPKDASPKNASLGGVITKGILGIFSSDTAPHPMHGAIPVPASSDSILSPSEVGDGTEKQDGQTNASGFLTPSSSASIAIPRSKTVRSPYGTGRGLLWQNSNSGSDSNNANENLFGSNPSGESKGLHHQRVSQSPNNSH